MTLEGALETTADGARDAVLFVFTVTNTGDEPVELAFTDGCKAEFVLVDDGNEVWRFSDGRMFAQVLSSAELDPGETTTYEAEWSDPDPGEYTAIATLQARKRDCEATTTVTVVE
ncbi:BsuPI-related putative proteinase inhibitor [Natrinema pallidum]|uniref:Intracellular proteinase inhibitor BsuPI domain-containing protein n=1 Tax=Natrinema pallidum DSM 3751 TaxID=1227495 RepID=L9YJV1_9EURY|nr:BsuPI-related putative proteinase inhibitor [Natrinema pallidum]ELY74409.1 hypothetical protein C487_14644 [Natrinema pallidum DSM 3751]